MKIKTKVLVGVVLSSVIATSLFAGYDKYEDKKGDFKKSCMIDKKSHKKMGNHGFKKHDRDIYVIKMLRQLNLSDDQKTKIKEIMLENRKNRKTVNEAFTKNSFDKQKYLEIISQKRENMLKSRADTIEKVYGLLTTKQKEQLKVLMDLKKEKRS